MSYDQTAAAAVGAAGNIAANVVSNSGNKASQERAQKANLDFWRLQNSYNHPTQQMARLKEAGLNPNMIYGTTPSSATGQADSIAPAKAAEYGYDNPIQDIGLIAGLKSTEAQTNNIRSQADVNQQRALLTSQQYATELVKTDKSKLAYKLSKEIFNSSAEAQKLSTENIRQQLWGKQLDNYKLSKGMKDNLMRIKFEADFAKENLQGQRKLNELRQLEINLNRLGIQKSDSIWARIFGQDPEFIPKAVLGDQYKQDFENLKKSYNRKN